MSKFFFQRSKHKCRVDSSLPPWVLNMYGVIGAAAIQTVLQTIRRTCQWNVVPHEKDDMTTPCIHCAWHENIPAYLAYYTLSPNKQHQVWLQHPAAYMAPIHTLLKWNNVDYVLGSSGHDGQAALEQLSNIKLLLENKRSAFFPDGPSGPIRNVKPGVVDVALATGLPIVPFRFNYDTSKTMRVGWDGKHFPIPFSKIRIERLEPLWVKTTSDREVVMKKLQQVL